MRLKRLEPTRSEDRLMVKELAHLFEGDELPVEEWQIEEEIALDSGFDWFETLWFATA